MARRKILESEKIVLVSIWVKKKNEIKASKEAKEIEKKYR